jgi:hypothetical protein
VPRYPPGRLIIGRPVDLAVSGEPAQLRRSSSIYAPTRRKRSSAADGSVTAGRESWLLPSGMSHGELTPGRYVCLAVIDSRPASTKV